MAVSGTNGEDQAVSPQSHRKGWRQIEDAPRDGTVVLGRRTYADRYTGVLRYQKRRTYWGKTSHVPLYGWNHGRDPEDQDLWQPTHWQPLPA